MMLLGALSALLIAALLSAATCAWLLAGQAMWRRRHRPPSGLDAQAALRRHPAGRSRAEGAGPEPQIQLASPPGAEPAGPDDDPDFISALERLIHGGEADQPG
jgi:hypothetical protein